MKDILKTFIFIVVMGGFSAGLIFGMDVLTKERIAENANYEWKSAILNHHGLNSSLATYNQTFENEFTKEFETENERDSLFRHKDEDTYSYYFFGGAVWGEINGVITLESDGITIIKITVLNQQETPGLGGVVAERDYLNNFVGKKFDPVLNLLPPTTENLSEDVIVDQITGATNTSLRFIIMLNNFYQRMMVRDNEHPDFNWMSAILEHHNITTDIDSYLEDFDNAFSSDNNQDDEINRVYKHKEQNTYSYYFEGEGRNGEMNGVITLESDAMTIIKITILQQVETPGIGNIVAQRDYLDTFVGKKFNPRLYLSPAPGQSEDVIVDQITGATTTSTRFINILNAYYNERMGS